MARVSPAPPEQVAELFGDADVPLRVRIYAQRPELAVKFLEFGSALREHRLLPARAPARRLLEPVPELHGGAL